MNLKKNQLKQLIEDLREKGIINFKDLAVLSTGAEQYIGECPYGTPIAGSQVTLFNPKRLAKYEMRHPQNPNMILVDYMVGDIDFISEGRVEIYPLMAYFIEKQDIDCQVSMAKLYLEYFERKLLTKVADAGLTLPGSGLIKGK